MRADAIGLFSKKVTKCRLLFLSKSDLRIKKNRARWKFRQMGQCRKLHFVRQVCRGRSPLCRECKGVLSAGGTRLAPTEAERRPAAPCWG